MPRHLYFSLFCSTFGFAGLDISQSGAFITKWRKKAGALEIQRKIEFSFDIPLIYCTFAVENKKSKKEE